MNRTATRLFLAASLTACAAPAPSTSASLEPVASASAQAVAPLAWAGPVWTGSEVAEVHVERQWQDGQDAAVSWADITKVGFTSDGQPHWRVEFAGRPPVAAELGGETVIAYGLVLETNDDGVADYVVGINNVAPQRSHFRVWVTDLATGHTDEQLGPPYGFPVEFAHPNELQAGDPSRPPQMVFTFLPGSAPPGVAGGAASFYAWASVTEGDEVVAWDYAPDDSWLNERPADEPGCPPVAAPNLGPVVMPPGSRELVVSVRNASDCPATLFVAQDRSPMGELVGTAAPAMIPAGMTSRVVFIVPPGQGWAIFVNPAAGTGPSVVAADVPIDASGQAPFTIEINHGVAGVSVPGGIPPGWFGN